MHIVFFVDFHDSSVGGVQTSVRAQKQALLKLGHMVSVVSPSPFDDVISDENTITLQNIPFFRPNGYAIAMPSKKNLKLIESSFASRPKIDIVHVQSNASVGILGHLFAKKHQIPLVQTMHGRDDVLAEKTYTFPLLGSWIARKIHGHFLKHSAEINSEGLSQVAKNAWIVMVNHADSADLVVFPSHHFEQKFLDRGLKNKTIVVSNGLSDETLDMIPSRKQRSGEGKTMKIMWAGRLSAEKRPIEAILAVSKSKSDVSLDIFGSGPMKSEIEELIATKNLDKKIKIVSGLSQTEILAAMTQYDMLLYNSFGFDNQPMVLLEATAAGLPTILCDPDLSECVPGGGSVTTDSPSADSISKSIDRLVSNRQELFKMSRELEENSQSVRQSIHTKKLLETYSKLAEQSKKSKF